MSRGLLLCSCLIGAAASGLAACAGMTQNHDAQDAGGRLVAPPIVSQPAQSEESSSLPPLPRGRYSSMLTESQLSAAEFFDCSPMAQAQGEDLVLDCTLPGSGPLQYAIYRWHPQSSLDSLNVQLAAQAGAAYIALPDYGEGNWKISGPYIRETTLSLNPGIDNGTELLSPAGDFFAAVIVPQGSVVNLSSLSLRVDAPGNAVPLAALNADVLSGDAPLTVQFDASGSSDPDGSIVEYAWDFDGNGSYEEISPAAVLTHVFAVPSEIEVGLRVEDNQGAHATNSLSINVTALANNPPTAVISPAVAAGSTPFEIYMTGSASYDEDPGDSIVLYEWDFDSNTVYDFMSTEPGAIYTYQNSGSFHCKLRVTDEAGNQATIKSDIDVNHSPQAVLRVSPSELNRGDQIQLDGSVSSDPDGSIVKYEWDLDGDGVFELDSGLNSIVTTTVPRAGTVAAGLRVTDNDGGKGSGTDLYVAHGGLAYPITLDAEGNTGWYPAIALVDGNPAIVYGSPSPDQLKYIRALDPEGKDWGLPQVISGTDVVELSLRNLIVVNGCPATAYFDSSTQDLRFVRAMDADGNAWAAPLSIAHLDANGVSVSLAVNSGLPLIAFSIFKSGSLNTLQFCSAQDADGQAWNAPLLLDTAGYEQGYDPPQLLVANGKPAIVFFLSGPFGGNDFYMQAQDPLGAAWLPKLEVEGPDIYLPSACSVNGYPAFTCIVGNGSLGFKRALDADGSAWPSLIEADPDSSYPFSSLAVVNGKPQIAYCSSGDLFLIEGMDPDGNGWGYRQVLDTSLSSYPSLCELANGHPAIAYSDEARPNSLRFIGWFD